MNKPVGLSFVHGLALNRSSRRQKSRAGIRKMPPKLVNVTYPEHHKVFTERLWELFIRKDKVDLEIGGVGVHQLILHLFVPRLAQLLETVVDSEGNSSGLDLGLSGSNAEDDFMMLVEFVYRGFVVGINGQQLESLRKLAEKLKVPLKVEDPRQPETQANVPKQPNYGAATLLNVPQKIPQIIVEKRHLEQPQEEVVSKAVTYVIHPRAPKKKARVTPIVHDPVLLDINNVPEGSTLVVRGSLELIRDRPAAKRRREQMMTAETGETMVIVESVPAGDSGSPEHVGATDIEPGSETVDESGEFDGEVAANPDPDPDPDDVVSAAPSTDAASAECRAGNVTKAVSSVGDVTEVARGNCEGPHKCPHCPYQTYSRHRLASHTKNSHDPNRLLLMCNSCDRLTVTKEGMERHLLTHKDDQQTYECKHCDYTTPKKANFQRHMIGKHNRTADDEPIPVRFKCDSCSYGCSHKSQLMDHVVHEHSSSAAPFKCPHCPYCSLRQSNLEKHINSVHLNFRPMMCHTCGGRFSDQNALRVHVRRHTKEKPYLCRISGCDKAFACPNGLKRHHLSHGNSRPFVCDQCGYSCKLRYNLRAHLKRHEKTTETGAS